MASTQDIGIGAPLMVSLITILGTIVIHALAVIVIVHFIRRRPDTYWLFVILFLGWIGALVYIVVEVIPDAGLLRTSFQAFPRRRILTGLETICRPRRDWFCVFRYRAGALP